MAIHEVLSALRKRWRLIVIFTLVGLVGASVLVLVATPKYKANVQLFLATRNATTSLSSPYQDNLASQLRMKSYVELATKEPVLQPVVDKLKLPYTWEHLGSEVSASSPTGTVLLNVSVLDPSPSRARDIANALGTRFSSYVSQLETVDTSGASVKLSVVQPANLPSSSATPKVARDLIAGLLLGLAVGLIAAFLREALDTTVKDTDDLESTLHLTGLGVIPFDADTPSHPLAVGADSKVNRGEAFRQLRTNLQFIQVDRQPRSILVTSSIAGEGKTTTAANIAISLAQVGVDVIVVEGDLRRPRLCGYLGLENAVGLTSVLVGWAELDDVLQHWGPEGTTLRVLGSGPLPPNPSELLATDQMRRLLHDLEDAADVVIIDGPPLLPVADSAVLAAAASGTLVVVRQGKTRREQVKKTLASLAAVDARVFGAVLNMAPLKSGSDYYYTYTYKTVPAAEAEHAHRGNANGTSPNGTSPDLAGPNGQVTLSEPVGRASRRD